MIGADADADIETLVCQWPWPNNVNSTNSIQHIVYILQRSKELAQALGNAQKSSTSKEHIEEF